MKVQDRVAQMRRTLDGKYPLPGEKDSYIFLTTELGELGDVIIRLENPEYDRNHQKPWDLQGRVFEELGDVMYMLATLASLYGVDLEAACECTCAKIENRLLHPSG